MASLPEMVRTLRAAGCVFAEDEARLLSAAAASGADLDELVRQRVAGQPLEHLLGWVEFCGLRVAVGPGVFVPRRRTELLAREAVKLTPADAVVVELCCGAAAVAAVVLATRPDSTVHAADVDPAAVAYARRNLEPLGTVHRGDLYDPLPRELAGRVDVLVANAPYVPTDEIALMPPEARLHEPRVALDGGPDGLDVARRIVAGARHWLSPTAHLIIETSERQAPALADDARRAGLTPEIVTYDDLAATVVVAAS